MKLTISVLQFCSRLPSSLWKLRQHVCAMCPLCEETFPTSIPREAGKGAAINNSRAWWTQVPSFSSRSYMGLMDTAIIPPERRWLFWTRLRSPNALLPPPKKRNRCVFWTRSSLWGPGLYSAGAPCYRARWKRQIRSVTEQPSWPHWNGNLSEELGVK